MLKKNAVGCYIEAVKKGLPTRTREGNPADVLPAHDAETGEIIDHEPLPPEPAAREAGDDAVAGASSSGRTEPSADRHISAQGAEETTGEPKAKADPDPETRVQIPRAEANPPETATESTSGVESQTR